ARSLRREHDGPAATVPSNCMTRSVPAGIEVSPAVAEAIDGRKPIVALETAVATHGLPHPANLQAMENMHRAVAASGSIPAACIVLQGRLVVGATLDQVAEAAATVGAEKASVRDLGMAMACGRTAGMTVSATLLAAEVCGIKVFATGGIGG